MGQIFPLNRDGHKKGDQEWSHKLTIPSNKVGNIKRLRMVFRNIFIELGGRPLEWKKNNYQRKPRNVSAEKWWKNRFPYKEEGIKRRWYVSKEKERKKKVRA